MIAPQLAEHADPDCTGTWSFEFTDLGSPLVGGVETRCTRATCTRCRIVHAFVSPDEAAPYAREATLHSHLLTGRV